MSTRVLTVGFQLNFSENIHIGEFFQALESKELHAISLEGRHHHILTDVSEDGFIIGTLLTYKGDKKIIATTEESEILKIEKIELSENQNSTAASMFCLNPKTKRGFFYSYHNGVTHNTYCKLFKQTHDEIRAAKIKNKVEELSNFKTKKINNIQKKANDSFRGNFGFILLQSHKDIENLLNSFSQINRFQISCKMGLQDEPLFKPIANNFKKANFSISVTGENNGNIISNGIKEICAKIVNQEGAVDSLKIFGKSIAGAALEESLGDNLEHYGVQSFDTYVESLPLGSWNQYKESRALKMLKGTATYQNIVIGTPSPSNEWKLVSRKDTN